MINGVKATRYLTLIICITWIVYFKWRSQPEESLNRKKNVNKKKMKNTERRYIYEENHDLWLQGDFKNRIRVLLSSLLLYHKSLKFCLRRKICYVDQLLEFKFLSFQCKKLFLLKAACMRRFPDHTYADTPHGMRKSITKWYFISDCKTFNDYLRTNQNVYQNKLMRNKI